MQKNKIGYLGGCWDLFHIGHLNYIREAKKQCDFLIVEVTPDEIVFQQKHRTPIINEKDRLEIIRAIKFVDKAELSDMGRDLSAYERYRYDVIFQSEDHAREAYYVELEKVLSAKGVKTVYLPYTKKISSTMLRKNFLP